MSRPSWRDYFMEVAKLVSTRATCDRASVGAVLVKDNRIIATGYNGAAPGEPHCDEIGHQMVDNHCIKTIHAEVNAIAQSAWMGISCEGADMYVYDSKLRGEPCHECGKVMLSARIGRRIYNEKV